MSLQGFNQGPLTYKAANAIATNLLVTLTTTAGSVDVCGASGVPVGIADGAVASGAYGNFLPVEGRVQVVSSATIAAGDFVKAAAAGQVAPEATVTTRTAATIGQAETAVSGSGTFWMVAI